MTRSATPRLITDGNIKRFFQESITDALARQRLRAAEATVVYLVNLLVSFMRSEGLFEQTPDGPMLKPLALIYGEALEAPSAAARDLALRRLGDVALFIAGLFSYGLRRKLVDIDYYVSMGGNAYGVLAERTRTHAMARVPSDTYAELARRFVDFVDVLAEVNARAQPHADRDLMRLYEIWLRTGSRRAARLLREAGVEPMTGASPAVRH